MEYQFFKIAFTQEKLVEYSTLLKKVFNGETKFSPIFLEWQYAKNPIGNAVGYDAYFKGELVAHYVTIPVLYMIDNKEVKGLLSLNTAVHPNHQGKGLFTQLAKKTYDEAQKTGYNFVVGVANQNSTKGFLTKLDFYLIRPLKVRIGVGIELFKRKKNNRFMPLWTKESINWRLSNPSTAYFSFNNIVYAKASIFGVCAVLTENPIKLSLKNPTFKLLIGLGDIEGSGLFINLPEKLKPSPLNLVFKDLTEGCLPTIKAEDVFFEAIDFDAY